MKDTSKTGKTRPPIVSVLGHVDHGKTTLLDAIRKTSVVKKEAGGITQSTGASVVETSEGKRITFIDTPGHAAFANMRSRGAKVADVAILVVAAVDGVKPQTKEALSFIREAGIPFIVAASKIDLASASIDNVKSQLEKEQVKFEGSGGDVALVAVSGKTGKGIDDLLEMISLVSELNEIKADPNATLEAVVIETGKDKRGPLASLVVRNGTLKVGDDVATDTVKARVRGLFGNDDKPVKEVGPGEPAQVMGFDEVPLVGSKVWHLLDKEPALELKKEKPIKKKMGEGEIAVVLKAKSAGSLEALLENLPEKVVVVASGVGDVNETDVFIAKSTGAIIFAFESKVAKSVAKLTATESVSVERFDVIYELFERLQEIVQKGKIEILAEAQIVAIFPYNDKKIAGCKVTKGAIAVKDVLIIRRSAEELGEVRVTSMKREKQNIKGAKSGEECGILVTPQLDFKVGDVLVSTRKA
jgi:translation initiation factor IF-2